MVTRQQGDSATETEGGSVSDPVPSAHATITTTSPALTLPCRRCITAILLPAGTPPPLRALARACTAPLSPAPPRALGRSARPLHGTTSAHRASAGRCRRT